MAKKKRLEGVIPYSISQRQSALMAVNSSAWSVSYQPILTSGTSSSSGTQPKHKFKKGDKVIFKNITGNQYTQTFTGQAVVGGYETYTSGMIMVRVSWDGGSVDNVYFEDDLTLVTKARPEKKPKKVDFDSVYLPAEKKRSILDAIRQIDHHKLIFDTWGFGDKFEKGTAVSMLFHGPPGTGKTMIGQAIADKYDKKLKVISTAEVESSEPGQAERNIKAFFEKSGEDTLLLFDECDSLIHDRAKVGMILAAQINALLMALEHYKGIVIFTTNRLNSLDPAFERRLSLKVEFEMPDAKLRKQIWQNMFPKKAPLAKTIDWDKIASVEIAGGNIKNVVLRTARMAANSKERKITQDIIITALEAELKSMYAFKEALATNQLPGLVGGDYRKVIG